MSEVVQMQVEDGVALLTLNRPERLNAWTTEMEHVYFALLEQCGADEQVRAIVVTGTGRGFCAGADMQQLQELGDGTLIESAETVERRPQSLPLSIPKPIIAAINGACAGIGLVQALMCDLRFAAEGAKLTTAFARRGLIAEHGISWILPRLVGPARALDLLLSGRVVFAEEAQALGLVNRVYAPDRLLDAALEYAARARRPLLAREHGDDEAPGLRGPRAHAARRAGRGRPPDARVVHRAGLRRGGRELRRASRPALRHPRRVAQDSVTRGA